MHQYGGEAVADHQIDPLRSLQEAFSVQPAS